MEVESVLQRILEPEIMDTVEDAIEYDSIPNDDINIAFMNEVLLHAPEHATTLVDLGCGPAHIPILFAKTHQKYKIHAVELAGNMIKVAQNNILKEKVNEKIVLTSADIKNTSLPEKYFDIVLSNSVVHHIHQPEKFFSEARRLASTDSLIYFKDLLRPKSQQELDNLVNQYAGDVNKYQRQLFRQSLHAALTIDEVMIFAKRAGLKNFVVKQTSDRHWTMSCMRGK